ncbi:HD domain-containing protein [Streptomyces scabiei]|uniref:HD domain-containing protein n=1 Tax=Streptomyces scabiei TaxID=1930 RepID=UPI001B3094A9|nr:MULTISPECIES: HD domain-containing protein [Streptomyces]MDX3121580.1 HD domain-containing protein [Streptomyces scabiei]MDX3520384.1 HD domain-containing protein [Streptomyces scabiei]QTU46852.1 HD domain-containing protein [Streptomyces sp. LBUM 1482]
MSTTPPAMSLVELAERKQLPRHQFTDDVTVRWIEENRPRFTEGTLPPLRKTSRDLLPRTAIPTDWLAEPQLRDSIHGIRHAMRTAVLAALLGEFAGIDEADTATLIIAAALHDCRRLHDKDDRGHGARAARWLTGQAELVWDHFGRAPAPSAVPRAAISVRLHDVPYAEFTEADEADYSRAQQLSDLVKAADALDRYRLPKLKWWPDARYVRAKAFEQLRATAFDLVVRTETDHLAGLSSAEAVLKALKQRELIS